MLWSSRRFIFHLTMITLAVSFLLPVSLLLMVSSSVFSYPTRLSSLLRMVKEAILGSVSSQVGKLLLSYLFFIFLLWNLSGNIPLNSIPTLFYSVTLTISLLFWVPLMVCVCYTDFVSFWSHLLPYGSPAALMLFLPLVELFSQVIRPLTLMIRLRTNLSSGHIMMYMFSYFTLLSAALSPVLYTVLIILFVLELCISALQAYIFVSLLCLYVNETL